MKLLFLTIINFIVMIYFRMPMTIGTFVVLIFVDIVAIMIYSSLFEREES